MCFFSNKIILLDHKFPFTLQKSIFLRATNPVNELKGFVTLIICVRRTLKTIHVWVAKKLFRAAENRNAIRWVRGKVQGQRLRPGISARLSFYSCWKEFERIRADLLTPGRHYANISRRRHKNQPPSGLENTPSSTRDSPVCHTRAWIFIL